MQQPPPPAPQSLVSRARTAIHSAAARVLTDIKADLRDADGSGGRSRAPSPRTSLDREPEAGFTGQERDLKPPSPRDEVWAWAPVIRVIQLAVSSPAELFGPVLAL